jgi:hypothetical protein
VSDKELIIREINKIKINKMQEYNSSYSQVSQIICHFFSKIIVEKGLSNNTRLIELIEEHKRRIYELHQEALINIEEYTDKEKQKVALTNEENTYPSDSREIKDFFTRAFDLFLYEISTELHARFEIEGFLKRIELENNLYNLENVLFNKSK